MHNTGLVLPVAMKHLGRSSVMEKRDLIQEGNLGLIKAIDGYSLDWGTRFSTFATLVIDQSISKAITNTGRWTRIPADMLSVIREMIRLEKSYHAKHGVNPDYKTLFELMRLSEATFSTVFHARRVASVMCLEDLLDRRVSGESGDTIQIHDVPALCTNETVIGISARLEAQQIVSGVDKICELIRSIYSAVDSEIYLRYYGFHDRSFKREAVKSICERFCVTPTYVEQVRLKCNKCIRKNISGVSLCDFSEERWSALVELSMAFE